MRTYFAYIRVSTVKQGEKGSSLTEQKDSILAYAQKHGLHVSEFFEEQQTAAKLGRAAFRKMLNRLKRGGAHGLIMHKVDRGARNLADWAEIAALKDIGIDVHFAHEAIDLNSRGGRLSADIQAVVASDFIRNLREEVKKGQQGRLKAGLYPFGVMPGYESQGSGKAKTIDPVQGPLVREAFTKYATGRYTLRSLSAHMAVRGLSNSAGRPLGITALSKMLSTSFYCGIIRVKGQTYVGAHEPLISKMLFDRVRFQAENRVYPRTRKVAGKDYAFRRLITCTICKRSLYAEAQKQNVYYRCHSNQCKGTCLSERDIMGEVSLALGYIEASPMLLNSLASHFMRSHEADMKVRRDKQQAAELTLSKHTVTMKRLTDLFVEGSLERDEYETRKTDLQREKLKLSEQIKFLSNESYIRDMQDKFLELVERLKNIAENENQTEIRETLGLAISNLSVSGKSLNIQWSNAISMLVDLGGSLAVRR